MKAFLTKESLREFFGEYLGTLGLVFFGTGAVVVNGFYGGPITHIGISLAFGIVVLCMILSFGEVSGAHMNPAVTIAFWLSGKFPKKKVFYYCLAQILGAISASLLLVFFFPNQENYGMTLPSGSIIQSFVAEVFLSFFLMVVIFNVTTGSRLISLFAAIAIGFIVFLEALVGGPICGASMNPARSISPAIVSMNFEHLWLYIVAPIIGTSLAVLECKFIRGKNCCK